VSLPHVNWVIVPTDGVDGVFRWNQGNSAPTRVEDIVSGGARQIFSTGGKKKKPKRIRRSEYESVEAYKTAMAALLAPEPKTEIIEQVSPLIDSGEDDDEVILMAVARLLH
jgi:hypothetical protein